MDNFLSRVKYLTVFSICVFLYASLCVASKAHSANSVDLPFFLQQQVTGVVTDNNGLPIPGVAVRVVDSSSGTVTNADGVYSLSVASDATLVFSYLGFETSEVMVDGRREINVRLVEDVEALGEVQINAGYYHTTRRESTGNISRVTAEEIELQPVVSPLQALQGRMAGVEITPGVGGHPGAANTIRIRGTNSLRDDGNLPLYIVDGMPINSTPIESSSLFGGIDPLNNLNLSNIESIEVLKDADATAIYGSRGANGVVLITTKKGKPGKTSIEARLYLGSSTVPNRLDLLNTEQYLQIRRQAFENDGVELTDANAYDLLLWDQNRYTDWQDFFIGGTSEMTNANLVLSGGSQNTVYRIGGSYSTQGSIYPGDYDYQKVTGEANISHTSLDNRFKMNLSSSFGVDTNNLVSGISFNAASLYLPPNAPSLFNSNGEVNWKDWNEVEINHPLRGFYNNSTTNTKRLIANLTLEYEVLKGLHFKSSMGYTFFTSNAFTKRPIRSYGPTQSTNNSIHADNDRQSWIAEPQIHYETKIGGLQIASIVGATFQQNQSAQLGFQAIGYASEALIGNLGAAEEISNQSISTTEYHYNALFVRLGLNWNKKYYLNITGRRDGSSRFGPDKRFANFGAIGASWIFTEEDYIKKTLPFLSFGKIRGSYGTTGNDQIGDYAYLDAYEPTRGPGGLYPTGLANAEYSWEENKKLEAAVELGFLEDRLNLSLSWYRNRSSNQLVGYPLPATTGFSIIQANLPATVQNSGIELEGSFINIDRDNLRWTTSINATFPRNELIEYPNIDQSPYSTVYRVGHPLNISFLYNYGGLDQETGLYTVKDINEDGRIDYKDQTFIHDRTRNFFMGLNNNVNYKNFSVSFFLEYVKHKGLQRQNSAGRPTNYTSSVLESHFNDRNYQAISQTSQSAIAYNWMIQSNFPLTDASFLRLKTLALSYSLPNNILQKVGVENLKIFLTGQNLLTFTKFKGLDPNQPSSSSSIRNLRTITGGIQLNI